MHAIQVLQNPIEVMTEGADDVAAHRVQRARSASVLAGGSPSPCRHRLHDARTGIARHPGLD